MATRQLTESFTMNGTDAFVLTALPLAYRPISFKVGGVETPTKERNVDALDSVSWYWLKESNQIFLDSFVPPVVSTVIIVIYEPISSNIVGASVPASIAQLAAINSGVSADPSLDDSNDYTPSGGSGIYEQVYDSLGLQTADQAAAVTAGILRRASVTPKAVSFKTDVPGWAIGQTLHTNHTAHGLTEDFIVVGITANPSPVTRGRGSFMEYAIEAVILEDAPTQSPADPAPPAKVITSITPYRATAPYEKLNTLSKPQPPAARYDKWQVVLGSGSDLLAGNPLGNRMVVFENQTLLEIYGIPDPAAPQTGQDLEIDIFADGVSILDSLKLASPDGNTAMVTAGFRGAPTELRLLRGQMITFSATYTATSGTIVDAQNFTVQFRGKVF